jgi:hypothetical protein
MTFTHSGKDTPTKAIGTDTKASGVPQPARRHRRRWPRWVRRLRKRLQLRVRWSRLLLVVVGTVAVVVVAALALIFDATNQVQLSLTSFERVVTSLSSRPGTDLTLRDLERLQASVQELEGSLAAARTRLVFLRPAAPLNRTLETTLSELDAASEVAQAADAILNGLQPTLFFLVSGSDSQSAGTDISSAQRLTELLQLGRGQFSVADQRLQRAQAEIGALNLTGVASTTVLELQQLIAYRDQLALVNQVLVSSPEVLAAALGMNTDRHYLVFSQNNDELRPSGGYLSTYGWMTLRNGRVTDYGYNPTTTTSPSPPPASYASQLHLPPWWLQYQEPVYAAWDGSWFADFPSTAKMAIDYYDAGGNPKAPIDGAIAIDITGFEDLLGVIGRVTVPGYDTAVTPDNFRAVVYNIRDFGAGELPHKKFLAALYQQIFSQWQTISQDPQKNTELLGALLDALQKKHIMLYFTDAQLDTAVSLLGWSGAQVPATDHDYLMVADANLGNKSNHSVIQSLTYDADVQPDGSISGKTTVTYNYSAQVAAKDPAVNPDYNGPIDYSSLMQFFVPTGTRLSDATHVENTPTVVNNPANTEFVTQVYIPFDSNQNVQFVYLTRPLVETLGSYQRYRLLVQKQPGTPANALDVQISLPAGARVISTTPDVSASYNLDRPILEFRTDLAVDRWIEIIYQDSSLATTAP